MPKINGKYLEESIFVIPEFVIVLDLHSNGLVTVYVSQLNVSGVAHEEGAIETSGPETSAGTHPHHTVKPCGTGQAVHEVLHKTVPIFQGLCVGEGIISSHINYRQAHLIFTHVLHVYM